MALRRNHDEVTSAALDVAFRGGKPNPSRQHLQCRLVRTLMVAQFVTLQQRQDGLSQRVDANPELIPSPPEQ